MCGIVGYVGQQEAAPILLDGLRRLEYRGYDSAGICVEQNGVLEVAKAKGRLQNLIAKTDGDNTTVVYNGTEQPLTSALAAILASISALPTGSDVDTKISTAISDLIGGAPETYDTLKEIADYISEHQDVVDTLNAAIGQKASNTDLTAAVARIAALEAKKVAEADLDTALAKKISDASAANHNHSNKTVLDSITAEKVAAWDGKAENTEATASAAGLMSAADKSRLDGLRGVRYGTTAPDDMQDGELFIRVVSE